MVEPILFVNRCQNILFRRIQTTKEFVRGVREKLKVVREKGYVTCDQELKSMIHFFMLLRRGRKRMGKRLLTK